MYTTPHDLRSVCECMCAYYTRIVVDRCVFCVQFERNISPDVIYVLMIAKMKVKWPIGLIRTVFENH